MNKKFFILLPALGLFLGACQPVNGGGGGEQQQSIVDRVDVDHESLSLQVGQTSQLNASVKPISLDDRSVTWSSDHQDIASVDASGMVTANATGTAHIRATANADTTKFAECTVTVTGRKVTIAKTSVADVLTATEELKLGANQKNVKSYYYFTGSVDNNTRGNTSVSWAEGVSVKLEETSNGANTYYVTFGDGANKQYFEMSDDHHFAIVSTPTAGREWSWNETYATVQRTIGETTYLPGTYNTYTTISGCDLAQAANDFFFQFVYQVDPVAPTSITLSASSNKIFQGGTLQIDAELAPEAADNNLVWSVTGDEHVSIKQEGLLTAGEEAAIDASLTVRAAYAEDETVYGELTVTVAEVINYGTLQNPLTIAQAKAVIDKFAAGSLTGEKMFVKGFVATNHGALSTSSRGDVWLTNDDGSVQKAFELYSVYADQSLGNVAANSLVGKEVIAEGWGTNYNGTYEFSNKNAAGDYDNGFIRAITDNTRAVTSLTLNPSEAFEIAQGGNKTVSATLLPYGASGTVTWAVSPANQGVTYENGKVVAAANATAGSYSLTATCGQANASVNFTVKVNDGSVEAVFDANEWATANNAVSGTTKFSTITLNNVVTISVSSGTNTGKIYGPGSSTGLWEIRCYKSESAVLTITVASGYTLVSAEGLIGSANWDAGAQTTLTVANNAVSFNNNNANFNIKSLTVVYKAA